MGQVVQRTEVPDRFLPLRDQAPALVLDDAVNNSDLYTPVLLTRLGRVIVHPRARLSESLHVHDLVWNAGLLQVIGDAGCAAKPQLLVVLVGPDVVSVSIDE